MGTKIPPDCFQPMRSVYLSDLHADGEMFFVFGFAMFRDRFGTTWVMSDVCWVLSADCSCLLRHRTFVEEHPGGPELVTEHGEPEREEGLLHRHEDLATVRQQRIDPLGLFDAVE